MLIIVLQNLLKILVFAALFAVEVSVAIPVVSLLFLLLTTHKERSVTQVFLLIASSLIVSSFISISWSLVTLLLSVAWFATKEIAATRVHLQNAALLVSLSLASVLAGISQLTFNYKTAIYTIIFIILAILISRVFLPRRMRHNVIDWISPGRA